MVDEKDEVPRFLSRVIASYEVPAYPGQWNVSRGSYSTSASLGWHALAYLTKPPPMGVPASS